MTCTACHYANVDDARFCEQCGQPFEMSCPTCGSRTNADARFCRRCGQNLRQPPAASQTSGAPAIAPAHTPSLDEKLTQLQGYLPTHLADKILASRGSAGG